MSQPVIGDIVTRENWWEDAAARREFAKRWIATPRQAQELPPGDAPEGMRECPLAAVFRHVLQPGHMFTGDGRCWVPGE